MLARNPFPPASSDNSLSASFPPPAPHPSPSPVLRRPLPVRPPARSLAPPPTTPAALTRGPILGLDLPPSIHQTDVLAVPLQDLYTINPPPPACLLPRRSLFSARAFVVVLGSAPGSSLSAIFRMRLLISAPAWERRRAENRTGTGGAVGGERTKKRYREAP